MALCNLGALMSLVCNAKKSDCRAGHIEIGRASGQAADVAFGQAFGQGPEQFVLAWWGRGG